MIKLRQLLKGELLVFYASDYYAKSNVECERILHVVFAQYAAITISAA